MKGGVLVDLIVKLAPDLPAESQTNGRTNHSYYEKLSRVKQNSGDPRFRWVEVLMNLQKYIQPREA